MERRLNQISEGLHTCLSCIYYKRKKCGAYFDVEIPRWSEEDLYMSSPEEREEREMMCLDFPCSASEIPHDDTPPGIERDLIIPDGSKARLRFLLKCYRLLMDIPKDNQTFMFQYGNDVESRIYDLIAHLDFSMLEEGKDIISEIQMMSTDYSREKHLYSKYPKGLIDFYLSQLRTDRKNENKSIYIEGETLVINEIVNGRSSVPENQKDATVSYPKETPGVFEEFTKCVSFPDIFFFLCAVLYRCGYKNAAPNCNLQYAFREPSRLDEYLSRIEFRDVYFKRWKEFRDYMGQRVKEVKEDEDDFRKLIYSILKLFHPYAKLFWAEEQDSVTKKESAFLLRSLTRRRFRVSFDEIASEWPQIVGSVRLKYHNRITQQLEKAYLNELDNAFSDRFPFERKPRNDKIISAVGTIFENMDRTATIIVGCMLENGIAGNYLGFQKDAGVTLVESINPSILTRLMEWTPSMTRSYIKQYEDTFKAVRTLAKAVASSESEEPRVEMQSSIEPPTIVPPPPDRVKEQLDKVTRFFPNGRWYNNNRKEYAVFWKVLYMKAFFKTWENNVQWKKLPIFPLQDGTLLSIDQLKGALKGYDEIADAGLKRMYEEQLSK